MKTWTQEEIKILLDFFPVSTNLEIQKMIPGKSGLAIYKKARKLGLDRQDGIEFLNRSSAQKGILKSGGIRYTSKGYRQVLAPWHPRADSEGYVLEHIIVWEQATGLSVPDNCCVHHMNEDKKDNRISNLCLMQIGAHTSYHNSKRIVSPETKAKISEKRRSKNA